MDLRAATANMDPERDIREEPAMASFFEEDKKSDSFSDDKKAGVYVNEKTLDNSAPTSDSESNSLYAYERDNMVRDDTGRIVVETSELAITALHVDDDRSLSPWTFRTFFLGIYATFGAVSERILTVNRRWTRVLRIRSRHYLYVQTTECERLCHLPRAH